MSHHHGPLNREQLAQFDSLGYLMVDNVFSDFDLQPLIDEITAEVDRRARELVTEGELSRAYEEFDFEHRLGKISAETDKLALAIRNGALAGPAVFALIRSPKLLDIAEQLCGPELIASSVYRLRPKIPNYDYGAVPWHQDSGYTEPYCDQHLMLTVWLPLVDASAERGCMWVIPGVHKAEVFPHRPHPAVSYLEIPQEALPQVRPVCVPVKKGGILLLTNRTPHASFDNTTDIVRWSMDLRYQNAKLPTNAQITRLPGEETAAPENLIPPACYPPEADFLVRSELRPDEVVGSAEVFRSIRDNHLKKPVTSRW